MIGSTETSPAGDHLFKIRDKSEAVYIPEEQDGSSHHTTAQQLYIATRWRRYVQTTVTFLTIRVKKPDEDDWMKLKRCLKYLKGTKHTKLAISFYLISIVKWWVDVSYIIYMTTARDIPEI